MLVALTLHNNAYAPNVADLQQNKQRTNCGEIVAALWPKCGKIMAGYTPF